MRLCLAAAAMLTALPLAAQEVVSEPRHIIVSGEGQIRAAPDIATLSVGVRSEAETTGDALDDASVAMAAILDRLAAEGIAAADVRTGTVRLAPIYAEAAISGRRQITGYRATNAVTVTLRDLAALGGALSAVVGEGANDVSGISFGLDDPGPLMDAARRAAVVDAAARAALYAEAAGVELGPVVRIDETGGGYMPFDAPIVEARLASAPQFDVPISAGEIELTARVTLVYAIAE